jgi:signal transduction histidine kinase
MRAARALGRRSSSLVWLILTVVVPPAATLAFLGGELLRQDRVLINQRLAEARGRAADAAILRLDRRLREAEALLPGVPHDGLVRFSLAARSLTVQPPDALLWWPIAPALTQAPSAPFVGVELLEFRGRQADALSAYVALTQSNDRATRAGAWLRVARVHRAAGRWDTALAAYQQLAAFDDVGVAGMSAGLQARRAGLATLDEAGRARARLETATRLARDLYVGRWQLDKESWDLAWADLAAPEKTAVHDADRHLASLAADALWRRRSEPTPGRMFVSNAEGFATVLRPADDHAIVVLPGALERWRDEARREAGVSALQLLVPGNNDGPSAAGGTIVGTEASRLPWLMVVGHPDGTAIEREIAARRRLLMAGLAAVIALLAGGGYVVWRLVERELAVARLKADFVAAVSHEFRTPLTSVGHIAELLDEDDDLPRERRRELYAALGRNAQRLRRLVESLLDFARLEAGRRPYDLQPLDVSSWVPGVVEAFRRDAAAGVPVNVESGPMSGTTVLADRSALTNALWNLLDNAVKYSPERAPVRVAVERRSAGVAIAVHDAGLGVDDDERDEIFERFVRGARARELGVPGTGLGLAMVSHIMAAHGGRVEMESAVGTGSTFRLVLPTAG